MKQAVVLLAVLTSLLAGQNSWAQWSDDELMGGDAPPPGHRSEPAMPDVFYGPNSLSLLTDSDNNPYIVICANDEFPIPVSYTIETNDTALIIRLRVWKSRRQYVPPNFMAPSDSFVIYAVYHDCPGDTAVFRMTKSDDGLWSVDVIAESSFVVFKPIDVDRPREVASRKGGRADE